MLVETHSGDMDMKGVSREQQKVYEGVCAMIGRAVIGLDDMGHTISKELIISALEQLRERVDEEGGDYPRYLDVAIKKLVG